MSQNEILNFLDEERKKSEKWFTTNEVKEVLRKRGRSENSLKSVPNNLFKLASFNLIQFRGVGLWKHYKLFRGNKQD